MLLNTQRWRGPLLLAIFLISPLAATAATTDITVVGPIESVNCAEGTFRTLGINFKTNSATTKSIVCDDQSNAGLRYVVTTGVQDDRGGSVATSVVEVRTEQYVPGVTAVLVRGIISSTNAATGQFQVSGISVNSPSGQVPPRKLLVDVLGTQPVPGGVVLADAVYLTDKGLQSEQLANAIIGTGASLQAIIGTGANKKAIIGTGAASMAIIGTGSSAGAIIGTGAAASAIIGTGVASSAIIGTGASTKAIIGTGSATKAIIGTGASKKAIIGTGVASNAIIGTG